MNSKGFITLTVVFEAMSLNRDEGLGNIQSLHLLTRGNGNVHSFMSRQSLTYAVRKCLIESDTWKEAAVNVESNVLQYDGDIAKYEEVDLFGFMITKKKETADVRPAAVTFTHAVSLEPYVGDMAFYANHEMVRRRKDSNATPDPYNRQEHKSLYKYSVVIDLNRVSRKDDSDEQDSKKARERLSQLLDALGSLHHQIAGYREPLYPLFVTAAHLRYGSPVFHNYVELIQDKDEESKLDGKLFKNGLNHADSILKDSNRKSCWAILEGSGDIHLAMDTESPTVSKEVPLDVLAEVKGWLQDIFADA